MLSNFCSLLWFFLNEKEIKNTQVEVTSTHPTEKYIEIKIADKNIKIHVPRYTKITKGGRDISFSDLNVGDKVNLSYVKRFDLWEFGEAYAAKTIKVVVRGDILYCSCQEKSKKIKLMEYW